MCQNSQASVVLAYDMDTTQDKNINGEIKDYLLEHGWQATVITQHPSVNGYYIGCKLPLPSTTLIKDGLTLKEAEAEFRWALVTYDAKHIMDSPARKACYNRAVVFWVNSFKVL